MSMMPQGLPEGEVVASFTRYDAAQQAVSDLVAADVSARDIAIVGHGLTSVERVTARLGWATAARSGAVNGILLGLVFSFFFVYGTANAPLQAFVGVMILGVAVGMLVSLTSFAIVRRRRDFASVMQTFAERYDVVVGPSSIHRAREVLGRQAAPTAPAAPAHDPINDEPPKYGERITPPRPAPGEQEQL